MEMQRKVDEYGRKIDRRKEKKYGDDYSDQRVRVNHGHHHHEDGSILEIRSKVMRKNLKNIKIRDETYSNIYDGGNDDYEQQR